MALELHLQRDRGAARPVQSVIGGEGEGHRALAEGQLGGGVHEVGDVGPLPGADVGDDVAGIDQAQLRDGVVERVGEDRGTLAGDVGDEIIH